ELLIRIASQLNAVVTACAADFLKAFPSAQSLLAELSLFTVEMADKRSTGKSEVDSLKVGNSIRDVVRRDAINVDIGKRCRIVWIIFQNLDHRTQFVSHLKFILNGSQCLISQGNCATIPELPKIQRSIE